VKPSSALKATDSVVAIGICLELHRRDNVPQWCLSTTLDEHGIGGLRQMRPARQLLGRKRA